MNERRTECEATQQNPNTRFLLAAAWTVTR